MHNKWKTRNANTGIVDNKLAKEIRNGKWKKYEKEKGKTNMNNIQFVYICSIILFFPLLICLPYYLYTH